MGRIRKQDLEGLFLRFCKSMERHGMNCEGWSLDYYAGGGGYCVQTSEGASPMGGRRRSAREMWDALYFASDALWQIELSRGYVLTSELKVGDEIEGWGTVKALHTRDDSFGAVVAVSKWENAATPPVAFRSTERIKIRRVGVNA